MSVRWNPKTFFAFISQFLNFLLRASASVTFIAMLALTACTQTPEEDEESESPPDASDDTEPPALGEAGISVAFDNIWWKLSLTIPSATDNETAAEDLIYEVRIATSSTDAINTEMTPQRKS